MEESVRLRVIFEDRHLLSKSQRKQGLKRTWVLLKPWHHTIYDLSIYILDVFQLEETCPSGLILSMDGFVLPPYESTCLFKESDIVSVKKKGKSPASIKSGDENNSLEKLAIVERQPSAYNSVKPLANEVFHQQVGEYESENGDDELQLEKTLHLGTAPSENRVSKKRKAPQRLRSSKKKNRSHTTVGEKPAVPTVEHDVCTDENKSINEEEEDNDNDNDNDGAGAGGDINQRRSMHKDNASYDSNHDEHKSITPGTKENGDISSESTLSIRRPCQHQESANNNANVSNVPGGIKKGPSRNARRKKKKRQWLREMAKIGKIEPHQRHLFKDKLLSVGQNYHDITDEPQRDFRNDVRKEESCQRKLVTEYNHKSLDKGKSKLSYNNHIDGDLIAVTVRPGHIRFEPLEEVLSEEQTCVSLESFQWNGITSKLNSQTRGTEEAESSKRMDCGKSSDWSPIVGPGKHLTTTRSQIEFEKLPPCGCFPKEGDLIAYRLIELSSTWTPELSSYRVGQVSHFDTKAIRITLKPVREYPIVFERKVDEEGSIIQPDTSLYGEDGSLEIAFKALIDVRIVKPSDSDTAAAADAGIAYKALGCQDAALGCSNNGHGNGTFTSPSQENKRAIGWEENSWELTTTKNREQINGWEGSNWSLCTRGPNAEANGWGIMRQAPKTDGPVNSWGKDSQVLRTDGPVNTWGSHCRASSTDGSLSGWGNHSQAPRTDGPVKSWGRHGWAPRTNGPVNSWGRHGQAPRTVGPVKSWGGHGWALGRNKPVNSWGRYGQAPRTDGPVNSWGKNNQGPNAKRARPFQKNNCNKKDGSGNNSWSNRVVGGGAVGLSMAVVRSQKQL